MTDIPGHEPMSANFEKFHLGDGWALHHFTGPDTGGPHDHPCRIEVQVLSGGYHEAVYEPNGSCRSRVRYPGDKFVIEPTHIHEIYRLLDKDCWTLVRYHPHVRETRFWRFTPDGPQSRLWNEGWKE